MKEKGKNESRAGLLFAYTLVLIALISCAAYRFYQVKWGDGIPVETFDSARERNEMCWIEYQLIGFYAGILTTSLLLLCAKKNALQESGILSLVATFVYAVFVVVMFLNDVLERRMVEKSLSPNPHEPGRAASVSPEAEALNSIFSTIPDPSFPSGHTVEMENSNLLPILKTIALQSVNGIRIIVSMLLKREDPSLTSVIDERVTPIFAGLRYPFFVILDLVGLCLSVLCFVEGIKEENLEKGNNPKVLVKEEKKEAGRQNKEGALSSQKLEGPNAIRSEVKKDK